MVRILRNWEEIGAATCGLQAEGLPLHESPQKNWDHWLLRKAAQDLPVGAPILDLGCGDGFTLTLLNALGFSRLLGLDLRVSRRARLRRLTWRLRGRRWRRLPYRLRPASMTSTGLPAASQRLVTCISAVEHGVPLAPFVAECARVLQPGGRLFLTTDYWEPHIAIPTEFRHYGQPWTIFDRPALEALIEQAVDVGLRPVNPVAPFPACADRPGAWFGYRYTFACVVLRRDG